MRPLAIPPRDASPEWGGLGIVDPSAVRTCPLPTGARSKLVMLSPRDGARNETKHANYAYAPKSDVRPRRRGQNGAAQSKRWPWPLNGVPWKLPAAGGDDDDAEAEPDAPVDWFRFMVAISSCNRCGVKPAWVP